MRKENPKRKKETTGKDLQRVAIAIWHLYRSIASDQPKSCKHELSFSHGKESVEA